MSSRDIELVKVDLNHAIEVIERDYIYKDKNNLDFDCLRKTYLDKVDRLSSLSEVVILFELLLYEFQDNHMTLTTNTDDSYRLFSPVYITYLEGAYKVKSIWQSQIDSQVRNIVGAEVLSINGIPIEDMVNKFPIHCSGKDEREEREWLINKIVSGKYSQPRILKLRLVDENVIEIDLDSISYKENNSLLESRRIGDIGYIRINNSLGIQEIVKEFDSAIDNFSDTQGLVLDLRNTIYGGNSYEARGIMSRFINEPKAYQRHSFTAKSKGNPDVERLYIEYVLPRGKQYIKPVVVLVGRWTGSMGEGLAIGMEGIGRGILVGTEMRRLAGEVFDVSFQNFNFGFKLPKRHLSHINGLSREEYIPKNYVNQTTTLKDEILEKGISILKSQIR